MRKPFWTKHDEQAQEREDEKAKGCLGGPLGCLGEGCLIGAVVGATSIVPLFWLIL